MVHLQLSMDCCRSGGAWLPPASSIFYLPLAPLPRAVLRRLKLLGAVAGVVVENVLGELISRARRRGVVWLKLF